MTTFTPLNDNVVILRDEIVTTTKGGLLLATGSLEKPQTGEILSIGPEVTEVKPGERVLYSNRAGAVFKIEGEEVFILKEENIIGILD